MKHFLIAGLSLLIFSFTSSLAIGEEVVASLPDAETMENVSNIPQEPAPSFIEWYKEQKWNIALTPTCEQLNCPVKVPGESGCCEGISGTKKIYWCIKPPHTCEMSKPPALRSPAPRLSDNNEKEIFN